MEVLSLVDNASPGPKLKSSSNLDLGLGPQVGSIPSFGAEGTTLTQLDICSSESSSLVDVHIFNASEKGSTRVNKSTLGQSCVSPKKGRKGNVESKQKHVSVGAGTDGVENGGISQGLGKCRVWGIPNSFPFKGVLATSFPRFGVFDGN
ncbi:hypothetical protein RHMOL_Rhmol04G0056500 [Rhododendron molle]|uniref:Uncharacterized protein n=1 Tax=Rhododendron molle TaxID=49168 RepID=A0ACC0NXM2_RHOML|nr:hypothetical protein RHMOL_Rhmol04G0056500 [Rhododendron molle]